VTTIVAVQGNGWVVVGWDARVAEDGGRVFNAGKNWSKVVRNNGYLLGAAGDVRAINLLHHVFHPAKADGLTGIKLDRFMTGKFIPSLREVFESEGYMAGSRSQAEEHGSTVLVVVNGVVFEIGSDWAWVRDDSGLYAIGSGGDYALGVLAVSDVSTVDACKQSVLASLKVASRFDAATASPFFTQSVLT